MKSIIKQIILATMLISVGSLSAQSKEDTQVVLETLGVLTGKGLYLTYVAIGATADGHAKGAYDKQMANDLLQEYINVCQLTRQQITKVNRSKMLSNSDKKFLNEVSETYGVLIKQAQSYQSYVKTGNASHGRNFNTHRQNAWAKIKVILGIKE